jgi:hypothetical protein
MGILTKYKINAGRLAKINYYQVITIIVAIGLIWLCLNNMIYYGMQIFKWDLLLISGAIVFIIAVQMAFKIPAKLDEMITRLAHRGTLQSTQANLAALKQNLQHTASNLGAVIGALLAFSLLLAFCFAFGFPMPGARVPITLLEVTGGFIAGAFLGHMCGYGRLGWLIHKHKIIIHIQPGHLDGVAGLKPVGDFYFRQAMIAALPAVFLAAWLLIIQFGHTSYSVWRTPYAVLLSIALVVEILVFVVPLISFHRMMVEEKRKQLEEADELSKEIALAEHELTSEQDVQKRELIKDRLSSMTKEYWNIENLPTWPVAKRTRKLFKRNNFTLLIPLIIDMIGRTNIGKAPWWHGASEIIEKVVK